MGLFSKPSSHNKGSLLSFCLIKSCLKCLTPLEETLVISFTPLDLTYDECLDVLTGSEKVLGKNSTSQTS